MIIRESTVFRIIRLWCKLRNSTKNYSDATWAARCLSKFHSRWLNATISYGSECNMSILSYIYYILCYCILDFKMRFMQVVRVGAQESSRHIASNQSGFQSVVCLWNGPDWTMHNNKAWKQVHSHAHGLFYKMDRSRRSAFQRRRDHS